MDRLAAGIIIAIAALAMNGGLVRDVMAEDAGSLRGAAVAMAPSLPSPMVSSPRSSRILSLVIALEALRQAPDVLDRPKG